MADKEIEEIIEKQGKENAANIKKLMKELKTQGLSETEFKRVNEQIRKFTKNLKDTNPEHLKLKIALEKELSAREEMIKASANLNEKVYQLARSYKFNHVESQRLADRSVATKDTLEKLGSAAFKGSGKISDFTDAFKGRLGGFGDAIVKIGSGLNANIDNYRTLANVGAAFGQNLIELRETAAAAGLPIEDFVKLISENSQVLAATYGSATQGAKAFSLLSESFRRTDIEFLAPLGLSIDDFNSALLTTINLQRLTGTFERDNIQGQTQSARGLITEIDKLAKLTGIQRSTLQKQMEAQMAQATFAAYANNQTEETRVRMQTFAATISTIAPEMKTGLLDVIANQGNATTQAGRDLVMSMGDASGVIQALQSGAITTAEALQQFQEAARRGEEGIRNVAETGTVAFVNNMYTSLNAVAKAQMNFADVADEAAMRNSKLTNELAQFQDSAKRLSASFQSIETGFFKNLGGALGLGIGTMNTISKDLSKGITDLSAANKTLLYMGTTLSSFVLDKAVQVAVVFAGTLKALKVAGFTKKGMLDSIPGFGGKKGKARMAGYGNTAAKGLGAAGVGLGAYEAYNAETSSGRVLGILEAVAGGALTGFMVGGLPGAAVGAVIGGSIAGVGAMAGASRSSGTMGEIGLPFEPRTSNLKVHAGERVLNPQETKDYNTGTGTAQYAQLTAQMTQYNTTAREALELQKANHQALNMLVSINAATEKNTKKTSKVVDKVGPSII